MAQPLDKSLLLTLLPVYIVIFIGFAGYSLMIAIFTPMFIHAHDTLIPVHASLSHRMVLLGIILMLYPLGQFLSSPIFGTLSDYFGRKPLLVISLLCCCICYVLIASALQWHLLTMLMISIFLAGLTEGNIVSAQSVITDLTETLAPNLRSQLFGYINLSGSLAYIFGPLIGGQLTNSKHFSWFNDAFPFWFIAIFIFLNALWLLYAFTETNHRRGKGNIRYFAAFTNLASIFTSKRLRLVYLMNFLIYLSIFGYFRSYPMYIVYKYHLNASQTSLFIAWISIPIIITTLWLNKFFSSIYSARHITIATACLTGICLISITFFNSHASLWYTLFITTFPLSLCLPASITLLSLLANPDEQGKVLGNNQSLAVAGEAISGAIAGGLAATFISLPFIIFGIISIIASLLLYFSSLGETS